MKVIVGLCCLGCLNVLYAAVHDVSKYGVECGVNRDQSAVINDLVAKAEEGDEVRFGAGVYYLERPIRIKAKKRLKLRGGKYVILKLHYSQYGNKKENRGAFEVYDSSGLILDGFTITTDNPTSCAGQVIATDPAKHTYDVRIDSAFQITGKEHFASTDTCDAEGTPDWIIETYDYQAGDSHELIGPQCVRVTVPSRIELQRLEPGHRVLYRHSVYDGSCLYMERCRDVVIRNIEIERCAGMGFVSRHCAEFTFERFNVRPPKGSCALVSSNADAIHAIAMRGHLNLLECNFERLGDDALNVHDDAGCVMSSDSRTGVFSCKYKKNGKVSDLVSDWARAGDELVVYDSEAFLEKGRVKLLEYVSGKGRVAPGMVNIKEGDVLANSSNSPTVVIRGCSVRNTRARGFLLQAQDVTISNCDFYGTSLAGVLIAPDARRWAEVGPVRYAKISNCRFEKCAFVDCGMNLGMLTAKTGHGGSVGNGPAGVHRNIEVIANHFKNSPCRGVFVASTDGLVVRDNIFENCCGGVSEQVKTVRCEHVTVTGNKVVSTDGNSAR